ncbi:hypothetical protein OOK06_36460 [Streptomyces sp. NBC_00340]|uniref:hypothetical protein n=1 Tax=Streptomyces sp. NBC_00340 TaxID=2975716 RepID=UPI00224EE355|nr:hypothetical protein [Streptomyces sp. NBC_00340]MCX5137563.1 hypothetical protein [Streptomyces sp. NBC_00340]
MPDDRIDIDREWAALLGFRLEERENAIVDGVLQQPDYPPLPECPECNAASTEISHTQDLLGALLINVQPCGHRFVVKAEM